MPHTDSFPFFHNLFFSCPSLTRACRSFLLLLPLAALAACSGDDEPPMPAAPAGDLQEVTLYLNLPALADSASKRSLGDPGSGVEEGEDWNTLVLFVVYKSSGVTTQKVRIETLTDEDYRNLPPSAAGSPFKRYTLTAPAGEVYFYGLTYHAPEANEDDMDGATALGDAIAACSTKVDVEGLTISNYYPYDGSNSSTDVAKFCSVASGYYQDASGNLDTYTIDYSHISVDPQQIPTLTLRRLAAKIDIQWDAEAAYSEGQYTNAYVTGFTYYGSAKGKVFPELHRSTGTFGSVRWDFYNRSEISWRNGRTYHYTFPDGETKAKVVFDVTTEREGGTSSTREYTMTYANALQRATWYKINASVKGNEGTTTGEQGEWTISSTTPGN